MHLNKEAFSLGIVVIAASVVALVSARPYAGGWNDGSRLATVECLVDHGTLAIDQSIFVAVPPEPTPYRGEALEKGTLDKLLIDGHFYSDKSPVPALFLAIIYGVFQLLFGLSASAQPQWFCWWMTLLSAGLAYVVAVVCTFQMGRVVGLALPWRLALTASFGLATVALVYAEHVNNHILLLGVAAALFLQAARLQQAATWQRAGLLGALAGLGYTIDLGAGPPLLACAGLFVLWTCPQRQAACTIFTAAAFPWLALHHVANYQVGGTFGPANAVAEYFNWEGCPFHGDALTGSWHHASVVDFVIYALALLFGKRGFLGNNLPLFLLVPAMFVLVRRPPQHWPVLLLAAIWSLGTWLVYAATSRNYSGNCCSIRWFVPLLVPAYLALAVILARMPRWRPAFVWLTMCGMLLMGLAWWRGPWDGHIGVAFWPIQAAALLGSTWRQVFNLSKVQQIENLPRRISVDEMPNRRHVLPARNQAV